MVGENAIGDNTIPGTINNAQRHPTVGIALFGPKVSDQLGSSSEELPVRITLHSYIRFRTRLAHSAYQCRSGGTHEFLPSIASGEIWSS